MFDKLKYWFDHGTTLQKIFAFFSYCILLLANVSISVLLGAGATLIMEKLFGSDSMLLIIPVFVVPVLSMFFIPAIAYKQPITTMINNYRLHHSFFTKKKPPAVSDDKLTEHFTKMLGADESEKLIENESFGNYVFKNGRKAKHLFISLSKKWICFCGTYYPIDFICGYHQYYDCFRFHIIDGRSIEVRPSGNTLPERAYKEIVAFFYEKGRYYDTTPENSKKIFDDITSEYGADLYMADWKKIRYQWEKGIAEGSSASYSSRHHFVPMLDDGRINPDFFSKVLTQKDIDEAARYIRRKKTGLMGYMDLKKYLDGYSVCNGVELLKALPYQTQIKGIDFLFDCLGVLDEPYFFMSVDLLITLPEKLILQKIEETAKIAYKSKNIQKMAGIMFLAQKLDYEIKYVTEIKENLKKEAAKTAKKPSPLKKKKASVIPGFGPETYLEATGHLAMAKAQEASQVQVLTQTTAQAMPQTTTQAQAMPQNAPQGQAMSQTTSGEMTAEMPTTKD